MTDRYASGAHDRRSSGGLDMPPVSPSDDEDLETPAKALRVYNSSDSAKGITFRTPKSGEVGRELTIAPGGEIIPCVVTRVMETGTDVGDLEIHAIID